MSRKNRRQARVLASVDAGEITPEQAQERVAAIESRPPYHAEEMQFNAYGLKLDTAALATYINTFSQEHDAALLQMTPTGQGRFLFLWDMT
jgi:hypothetical protein